MSLDVYLEDEDGNELYSRNITHNLNKMADAAGVYKVLWRPEEIGIKYASQIIEPLTEGLTKLVVNKQEFEQYNPKNGWGDYEGLVMFCADYLQACKDNSDALISVSR